MDYSARSDRELSEHIAKLLGYTCEEEDGYWPNREMVWRDKRGMKSHEPRYASDMNAAVELLRECWGELLWDGEGWHVEAHGYLYASHPTNPARAIAECWLQWRAGQKS